MQIGASMIECRLVEWQQRKQYQGSSCLRGGRKTNFFQKLCSRRLTQALPRSILLWRFPKRWSSLVLRTSMGTMLRMQSLRSAISSLITLARCESSFSIMILRRPFPCRSFSRRVSRPSWSDTSCFSRSWAVEMSWGRLEERLVRREGEVTGEGLSSSLSCCRHCMPFLVRVTLFIILFKPLNCLASDSSDRTDPPGSISRVLDEKQAGNIILVGAVYSHLVSSSQISLSMSYPPQHSQGSPQQPGRPLGPQVSGSSPNDQIQCLNLKSLEERGLIQEEDGARFIKVDVSEAFRLQRPHILVDKLAKLHPSRPAGLAMAEFKVCQLLIKLINEKELKENKLIQQISTLQAELSRLGPQPSRSPITHPELEQELPNFPQPQEARQQELKSSLQFFKSQAGPNKKRGNPKDTAGKQPWEAEEKKERQQQQQGPIVTPRQGGRKDENQEFPLATTEAKEEPQERERRRQRKAKRGDRKRHKFTRINYDF